jgi:hypothetical protein
MNPDNRSIAPSRSGRYRLALGAAVLIVALGGSVPAARAASPPPDPATAPSEWYGYYPALTDLAAVGLLVGAAESFRICLYPDRSCRAGSTWAVLGIASLATYALASPLIHIGHGQWGKAGLSLGVRATPFVLAALPLLAGRAPMTGGMPPMLWGLPAVMVIDDGFLARRPLESPTTLSLAPTFDPQRRGGVISLARAF